MEKALIRPSICRSLIKIGCSTTCDKASIVSLSRTIIQALGLIRSSRHSRNWHLRVMKIIDHSTYSQVLSLLFREYPYSGIFGEDKTTSDIDSLLGAVRYRGTKGKSDGCSECSAVEVIDEIARSGGLAIPAHVDQASGLLRSVRATH